jgi:hypothetical protein
MMIAVARRSLLFLWELPQNLLGLGVLAAQAAARNVRGVAFERERVMIEIGSFSPVSLGLFVFFSHEDNHYVPVGPENRDHEYGHSFQSRWLGPLYLPIVGVSSELRVAYAIGYRHVAGRRWLGYYDGFPERWADELGGVDTALRPR